MKIIVLILLRRTTNRFRDSMIAYYYTVNPGNSNHKLMQSHTAKTIQYTYVPFIHVALLNYITLVS